MGITISLETEQGEKIEVVADLHNWLLSQLERPDLSETLCLRYLDPWGNTIFNHLQMDDLLQDLRRVRNLATNKQQRELLDKIEEFAERCTEGVHLYVKFSGD
jgi:hypothetical protein